MFQLSIADTDITNGALQLSWCIDQEVLKEFADDKVKDPQVVICVAPEENYHISKEYRKIVPLKDLMTFVELHCAGKVKIYGWVSMREEKELRNQWLSKICGCYDSWILDYNGTHYFDTLKGGASQNSFPISIDVPKEVFAPEPFDRGYVNHFFSDKLVDQCHFRRRRMFAYTVQPLMLLALTMFRVFLFAVAASILCSDIPYHHLWHPIKYSMSQTWDDFFDDCKSWAFRFNPSIIAPKPKHFIQWCWRAPAAPIVWLPPVIATLCHNWLLMFMWPISMVFSALFLLFIIYLASGQAKEHLSSVRLSWILIPFIRLLKPITFLLNRQSNLWYLDRNEMDLLVCEQQKKPTTYASIPMQRKSIKLRYQHLKSKVCKPFSR